MKIAETVVHVLLLLSAVTPIKGIRSSDDKKFDQFEACAGQDGIVLRSDADVGVDPTGWFVYSGSLIFCCAGLPYAVTCTEMMMGYCNCPMTLNDYNTSNIVCYARTCTSQVLATPILNGKFLRGQCEVLLIC
jgi:hypothetical protein